MDGSSKGQQGVGAKSAAETESTAPVGLRMSLVCLDIATGSLRDLFIISEFTSD